MKRMLIVCRIGERFFPVFSGVDLLGIKPDQAFVFGAPGNAGEDALCDAVAMALQTRGGKSEQCDSFLPSSAEIDAVASAPAAIRA